ncbi:MAG: arsenite methyltransferase [Deltaproteobacteria bacterium]|nr:arsenite methyltransferase [Deltaproteobacteria bacterium]
MDQEKIKEKVREGYGRVALENRPCCGASSSCCGSGSSKQSIGEMIGYSKEEMSQVPEGANLGLGCGNPVALASLREGQTVLDLGSGAGFDCFLAAKAVGEKGRVIGVDMTPEMVKKAWENAKKGGYRNVEFRLGDIEYLPVIDESVDVILSNCVINLSPEKPKVFAEAFRVLKPGGKLTLSDVVLLRPLPPLLASSAAAYLGCVAGASLKNDYLEMLHAAGFKDVRVVGESPFYLGEAAADPIVQTIIEDAKLTLEKVQEIGKSIVSIKVVATKAV